MMWKSAICRHKTIDLSNCVTHALVLASMFVLNLYVLVPKSIRTLSRNNTKQIKWRIVSVLMTVTMSVTIYPYLFCYDKTKGIETKSENLGDLLGFWRLSLHPLFYGMVLYTGPIITTLLKHRAQYMLRWRGSTKVNVSYWKVFLQDLYYNLSIFPISWGKTRDLLIAPLAEEVIFRSCMVTPFLHSTAYANGTISIRFVSWITPLFFGVAHFHHALRRFREENCGVKIILLTSAFQFSYTTIFGAYASYCFMKYKSLLGVVLLHSFCNHMGLPQLRFFFLDPDLLPQLRLYKAFGLLSYISGIVCFYFSFQ